MKLRDQLRTHKGTFSNWPPRKRSAVGWRMDNEFVVASPIKAVGHAFLSRRNDDVRVLRNLMIGIDVFWPRDKNCGKFTSWNLKDTAVRRTGRKHSRLSGLSWLMIAKALDQTKERRGGIR